MSILESLQQASALLNEEAKKIGDIAKKATHNGIDYQIKVVDVKPHFGHDWYTFEATAAGVSDKITKEADLAFVEKKIKEIIDNHAKKQKKEIKNESVDISMQKISQIFGDSIVVALSQVESITGEQFSSIEEMEQFVQSAFNMLKTKGRSTFVESLNTFQRIGNKDFLNK